MKLNFIKKFKKRIKRVPDRMFWYFKIRNVFKQSFLKNQEKGSWENDYSKELLHHSHQNKMISIDFIKKCKKNSNFDLILKKSNSILDFGCGSGELSYFIKKEYKSNTITGVETSDMAVNVASFLYSSEGINFLLINPEDNISSIGNFDLVICSQVLEHFKDPYKIIDKILNISEFAIIIVPYNQLSLGKYEKEGGLEHVYSFTEKSFNKYNIIDSFVFETLGWDYSSNGEQPKELAVLIKK